MTFYKPVEVPSGYSILGYYGQNNSRPRAGWVLAIKENGSGTPPGPSPPSPPSSSSSSPSPPSSPTSLHASFTLQLPLPVIESLCLVHYMTKFAFLSVIEKDGSLLSSMCPRSPNHLTGSSRNRSLALKVRPYSYSNSLTKLTTLHLRYTSLFTFLQIKNNTSLPLESTLRSGNSAERREGKQVH